MMPIGLRGKFMLSLLATTLVWVAVLAVGWNSAARATDDVLRQGEASLREQGRAVGRIGLSAQLVGEACPEAGDLAQLLLQRVRGGGVQAGEVTKLLHLEGHVVDRIGGVVAPVVRLGRDDALC